MQDQIAILTLGIGFALGVAVALKARAKSERTMSRFWKRAYDSELKKHADTKEEHYATIQNIANVLAEHNLQLSLNDAPILPLIAEHEECHQECEDWPSLIGEK